MGNRYAPAKPGRLAPSGEAARIAGLSPNAISRRIKEGAIAAWIDPSDRRVRLVDLDELDRYLATPQPVRHGDRDPVRAA